MLTFSEIDPERPMVVMALLGDGPDAERRFVLHDRYSEDLDGVGCMVEYDVHHAEHPGRIYRVSIDPISGEHELAADVPAALATQLERLTTSSARYVLFERLQEIRAWKELRIERPTRKGATHLYSLVDFVELAAPPYLHFFDGDEPWTAIDWYCVQPRCDCQEANLTLVRSEVPANEDRDSIALRYRLTNDQVTRNEDDKPLRRPEAEALDALRETFPDLGQALSNRRRLVRALAAKRLTFDHIHAAAPRAEPVQAVRVGRNDPCPCGSGKKHKRCCG